MKRLIAIATILLLTACTGGAGEALLIGVGALGARALDQFGTGLIDKIKADSRAADQWAGAHNGRVAVAISQCQAEIPKGLTKVKECITAQTLILNMSVDNMPTLALERLIFRYQRVKNGKVPIPQPITLAPELVKPPLADDPELPPAVETVPMS